MQIDELVRKVTDMRKQALVVMNARYDEFEDGFDLDYPDGPIGDPDSLVNEARVSAFSEVLRVIEGGVE